MNEALKLITIAARQQYLSIVISVFMYTKSGIDKAFKFFNQSLYFYTGNFLVHLCTNFLHTLCIKFDLLIIGI